MSKASVIITTHSRPYLLPRAVESAKASGRDVEVIVVDDASTDETEKLCRSLVGIQYIRLQQNQRVGGARNAGLLASTADFVSFHDDDDFRFKGSLDKQISLLEASPEAGFVYSQVVLGDEEGKDTGTFEPPTCPEGDLFWQLLVKDFIPCLSIVFRKAFLLRVGMLDASIPGIDDWDIVVRMAERHPVVALNEPIGVWRTPGPGSDQGSARMAELLTMAARTQQEKWLKLPRAVSATPHIRREVRKQLLDRLSDMLIWSAATYSPGGFHAFAQRNLVAALRIHPMRAFRPWTLRLLLSSIRRNQASSSSQHSRAILEPQDLK